MRKRKRKNTRTDPVSGRGRGGGSVFLGIRLAGELGKEKPEELLARYMGYIETGEYEKMYEMVDGDTLTRSGQGGLHREKFQNL